MPEQRGYARTVTIGEVFTSTRERHLDLGTEPITGNHKEPDYLPSLEEISEECRAIQSGWCDEERHWRAVGDLNRARAVNVGRELSARAKKAGAR